MQKKVTAEYVVEQVKELFEGDYFIEELKYEPSFSGYYEHVFLDGKKPKFCNVYLSNIIGEFPNYEAQLSIVESKNGVQLIGNGLLYVKEDTINEMSKCKNCSFGIRNNRIGVRETYVTTSGEWYRLDYFQTTNRKCAKLLLDSLKEFQTTAQVKREVCDKEIPDFAAAVWKIIVENFDKNKKMHDVEFFPAFIRDEERYYDCMLIPLDHDVVLEIRRYPDYSEFVCENPSQYWRSGWLSQNCDRGVLTAAMRQRYDIKMLELEESFVRELTKIDENSILLTGGNPDFPYMQVREFRTSNIQAVETFCKCLVHNEKSRPQREISDDKTHAKEMRNMKRYY